MSLSQIRFAAALTALSALILMSCGPGEFGYDDSANADDISAPQYADPDPEDTDGERAISYVSLSTGSSVYVCQVSSGLNHRAGPGTGYRVRRVLRPRAAGKVTGVRSSWARFKTSRGEGWSHRRYLCKGSAPKPPAPTSGSGGSGKCSGFIHPAHGYRVTSNFGACRSGCSRRHAGIDLGTPRGTRIRASDGGVVIFVGWRSGYGKTVEISHCGRYTTRYAHLNSYSVRRGQRVSRGQVVARSGNTGIGTGPHLHFEVRRGGAWGTATNPRNYVRF